MAAVDCFNRRNNLSGGFFALHKHRINNDVRNRIPLFQNAQNIAHGGTCRRRHNSNARRQPRNRLFMSFVKQSLLIQELFELFKCNRQRADAIRHHVSDIHLILSALRIYADTPPRNDFHPVFRLKAQTRSVRAKHHG